MTQKPKTEAEQIAFFESVHERFLQAVGNVGEVHYDYRIAGTVVRLSFAGERLVPYFTRALEHLRIEPVETPAIEYTDALGKFLPDVDRPNQGVFSLQDDDEQWLSLRYDLTAPLARFVAQNFDRLPKPYRSYRCGHVYRNEKPGPGRFRQFMQFDADTVGSASPAAAINAVAASTGTAGWQTAITCTRSAPRWRMNSRTVPT